jgi:hypothetical protein
MRRNLKRWLTEPRHLSLTERNRDSKKYVGRLDKRVGGGGGKRRDVLSDQNSACSGPQNPTRPGQDFGRNMACSKSECYWYN